METKSWTFVDKSAWAMRGEWDREPDKVQWTDEATGLPCLVHRGPSGALCGYVGVAEGHKFFGTDYEGVHFAAEYGDDGYYPEVHGGLTFADFCAPETAPNGKGICHIPGPGEPDRVWWLGFDCAHSGDLCPSYAREGDGLRGYESYKPIAYVQRKCAEFAEQLSKAGEAI